MPGLCPSVKLSHFSNQNTSDAAPSQAYEAPTVVRLVGCIRPSYCWQEIEAVYLVTPWFGVGSGGAERAAHWLAARARADAMGAQGHQCIEREYYPRKVAQRSTDFVREVTEDD